MDVDPGQELIDLLECPICTEFMYSPIHQCPNGHSVCSICKPRLENRCPQCQGEIGDIRALVVEKMASLLLFPCRHSTGGCSRRLKYDLKEAHEEECNFRPFNCPFPDTPPCVLTGDVPMLLAHLLIDHDVEVRENYEIDELFVHDNPDSNDHAGFKIRVYSCHSAHFCLRFEDFCSPTDRVYMTSLTFLGDEIDASRFRYNLEIGNDEGKISWQGKMRSIRDAGEKIRDSYDGLVIHHRVAQKLAELYDEEAMMIRVKGFVWAIDEL